MDMPASSSGVGGGGQTVGEHVHETPFASSCATGMADSDENQERPLPHLSIEQQRLQSGRNRLGTPRHEQRAAGVRNCDTQNQLLIRQHGGDSASVASGTSSTVELTTTTTTTTTTETSNQAPPSYGTATRSCATLDAGQLHQIHMERQRQLMLARAQQQASGRQPQQQMASSSSWHDRVGQLERNRREASEQPQCEHINQTGGQHYRLSNFESYAEFAGRSQPAAAASSVSCTHSLGNLAAILRQQQQQQQQEQRQPPPPIDDSYGFLSRAAGQQRVRPAVDKDQQRRFAATLARGGGCGGSQVNQFTTARCYGQQAKKQEEGIYATLNVAPVAARLPINHVISGRASMQLAEQQQQRHFQQALQWPAPAALQPPPPPPLQHNCLAHNHNLNAHQPQLQSHEQQEQTNQLASSTGRELGAPNGQTTLAAFDCATATATGEPPTQTTDRLIDISSSSCSTTSSCGGHHQAVAPATASNVDNVEQSLRHCATTNSLPQPNACVTSKQNSSTLVTCQNNDFSSRATQQPLVVVMAATATTTRCKDDAKQRGVAGDKNRKRGTRSQRLEAEIPGGGGAVDLASFAAAASQADGQGEPAMTTTTINYGAQKLAVSASEQTSRRGTLASNNANNQTAAAAAAGPTTISAHRWLIDSGDESLLRNGEGGAPKSPACSNYDAARNYTLAPQRTRSIDRLERTKRLGPGPKLCQTLKPRSRQVHQRQTPVCVATSLSSPNVTYDRSDDDGDDDNDEQDEATTDCEETRQRRRPQRRHRRRTRTSRTTSRRPPARSSASSPYENASTVVRLSAVLSFVSNLVSGKSRSRQRSNSKLAVGKEQQRYAASAASTSSYSNRTLPGQSYTTTGASSMAYSSSTSAYVTGNSSLHSHDCHSSSLLHVPAPSLASQTSPRNRTPTSCAPFVALRNGAGSRGFGSQPPDGNPQQLYTVSIPSTAVSHHSYEYCDNLPPASSARAKKVYDCSTPVTPHISVEHLELTTMSNREQPWTSPHGPMKAKNANSCDSNGASCSETASSGSADRATCSPAQMVGLSQTGLTSSGRPLAQTLMSDNELISSAASCSQQIHVGPAASRRKWWWNSFKLWLTRRSCHDTRAKFSRGLPVFSTEDDDDDDNGSLTHQRPAGAPNGLSEHAATGGARSSRDQPAARYRCLKPALAGSGAPPHRDGHRGRQPGTLQNVISLAKVDRVFRCRLLASLVISLLLLVLICLLALMIYKRGSLHNLNHLSNGRLSLSVSNPKYSQLNSPLLIDDDDPDFDLSWLWPAQQQQQQQLPISVEQQQQQQQPQINLDGRDLDGQLRSLLHVIDRSERIQQFQLTITHLTNLQLANDHFIDLTQLARILPGKTAATQMANLTSRSSYNESSHNQTSQALAINQLELDLASLTLLSNLYWPLVKWRHQSQRSLASNFLAFALSSATSSGSNKRGGQAASRAANGDAGASAIRNLLASLILVESFNPDNLSPRLNSRASTPSYVNLQQFQRLNLNLRLASYHLLTCAMAGNEHSPVIEDNETSTSRLLGRDKFCQLLTRRYKRMMLALGELEHGDLAELHRREQASVELPASVHSQDRTATAHRDKNILGFLLDRLTLLDVRLLAELTLSVKISDYDDLESREETGGQDAEPEASMSPHFAIELIVTNQQQIDANSGTLTQQLQPRVSENQEGAHATSGQLYDLVKNTVGDNPINLMASGGGGGKSGEESANSESITSFQELQFDSYLRHFDQLRSEQPDRWYDELLVKDLINPWPARALPPFVRALNYDLFLHPNLTSQLVLGMNKIEFELTRPTRFILLNCAHLNVIELSLWMKQPPVFPSSPSLSQPDLSSNRDNNLQAEVAGNIKQDKRQIAVRRVLNLAESEMLFIELQEPIEPFSSLPAAKQVVDQPNGRRADFATSSTMANGVEFGELPARSDQFHATPTSNHNQAVGADGGPHRARGGAFVRNQFVLNISFNKTNTMMRHNSNEGIEFVRYADYFSGPPSSQDRSSQAPPPPHHLVAEDGTIKSLMFTKFGDGENYGQARHLFPCWDEPSFGAKFQLNLVHDYNSQVLFTGQKRERLPYNSQGSLQMTVFEQTPVPLSPSLLALVISDDLHSAKSLTSRYQIDISKQQQSNLQQQHVQVQIWAQFEQVGQTEFASQQLVPQLLAFFQTHLEFAYPLDKIDLVAIPLHNPLAQINELDLGESSEGLGLLRFPQPEYLLVDVNLASQEQIEQVAAGISHQLAHQFFGNIISVPAGGGGGGHNQHAWWLFEALCEYLGGVALAQVQPEWRLDEQFQQSSVRETLESEQLDDLIAASSHPLWARNDQEFTHTDGATGAASLELDSLVSTSESSGAQVSEQQAASSGSSGRGKHSALIHMMLTTLLPTQEARARLLQRCLRTHQYSTMSANQFWRHFNQLLRAELAAHDGRLDLATAQRVSRDDDDGDEHQETATDHLVHVYTEAPPGVSETSNMSTNGTSASGRVVFVSHRKRNRKQSPAGEHKLQMATAGRARATRQPYHWLAAAANQWLEQASFPLVTASCYRDHLQLRQDPFRPLASGWLASKTGGDTELAGTRNRRDLEPRDESQPPVWPIPLLFVSRLNPKSSRFVWLAEREAEVSLLSDNSSSGVNLSHSGAQLAMNMGEYPPPGGTDNRLPQQYSWFKLNHNGSSLVRVNYDERNWEALTSLLARAHYSNHLLNPLDRANLLDDAMTLMRHGQLSVNLAMNLTLYLELGERDYQPWSTILSHFDQLQTLLNQNPLWHQYVLKLLQPISIVVGWKDDGPHLMRKLRRELYALAIGYGDEKILAKARQEFRAWQLRSNTFLVPNLQELVYVAGVKYGDQAEWFHCWQKYQQLAGGGSPAVLQPLVSGSGVRSAGRPQATNETTQRAQLLQVAAAARNKQAGNGGGGGGGGGKRLVNQELLGEDLTGGSATVGSLESEKRQLLTALASTQNTWLLEQFLNYSLDSTKIQAHHLGHVLATLGKNPVARLYLWRFVRLNWFHLEERFLHSEPAVLESMILESTRHFASELDYEEVSSYFESKWSASVAPGSNQSRNSPPAQVKRAIQASLAAIRANIRWRNSIEPKLTRWLSHYNNIAA